MSIWLVIMVAGRIATSIGPLPMDMQTCRTKELNFEMQLKQAFIQMQVPYKITRDTPEISFACVESASIPKSQMR